MAFYIYNPDDYHIAHVDRDLHCPFCKHNNIEVIDEDGGDGYGRHIVRFSCDIELSLADDKIHGCDRMIELWGDTMEECKEDYRSLSDGKS